MSESEISILQRIMKYCATAERSTHDVLTRLISWGIPVEESEIIIEKLRRDKFLNDKRFATHYVSEKWNLDRWGKIKIEHALHQKNIDEAIIEDVLLTIKHEEYVIGLHDLLQKKLDEVSSGNGEEDARRIMMFAQSRGFEDELIREWLELKKII